MHTIILCSNHFIFAFLRLERVELGYWPFVKELTHSETAKHIANHPQVTNDLDKGKIGIHIILFKIMNYSCVKHVFILNKNYI